jgi:hypothetical protein
LLNFIQININGPHTGTEHDLEREIDIAELEIKTCLIHIGILSVSTSWSCGIEKDL